MKSSELLIIDGIGNIILGFLLMAFPRWLIEFLGLPSVSSSFYLSVFGGVLFGIGIALLLECFRGSTGMVGLGLGGAIAINLCFGIVLALWLVFGGLDPSPFGAIILWVLVAILILISATEIVVSMNKRQGAASHNASSQ